MEGEGCVESVGGLATTGTQFQVIAEEFAIARMSAVVDDLMSAFNRVEAAEVSDALIGYNNVDGVFCVVDMRNHRYDIGNLSFLSD